MTRTKTPASAATPRSDEGTASRERARRTSAAARLRACANVFARSRIHFDPVLHAATPASATDRRMAPDANAPVPAAGTPDRAPGALALRDESITIH